MITQDRLEREEESFKQKESLLHVHFLHRHIPLAVSYLILIALTILAIGMAFLYVGNQSGTVRVFMTSDGNKPVDFIYGSWPALENADFFNQVKDNFISKKTSFIEADLSAMIVRLYQDGNLLKEYPILSTGREGSWWETPAGLYQIGIKEENHFSSFGQVYMPWSMQFQGNFFIHGPTVYPDGSLTPPGYSGGCIRLEIGDVEEVYKFAEKNMPVLIFKEPIENKESALIYEQKKVLTGDTIHLVADLENNFIFSEESSKDIHSIASITKLISALVAVEYINVEKDVTIDSSMLVPTSIPRLKEGEQVIILDLLSLMLMESSNEASVAVASVLGNSQFVKLMNEKAKAIGMKDSKFEDASGVLSGNMSSAEDLFLLMKYLYYNRSFVLHMSMGNENRVAYGSSRYNNLQNLNSIAGIPDMIGGKTGLSTSSGDSMVALFELEMSGQKRPVVAITIGSNDAKKDISVLIEHIKNNFSL